MVPERICSLPSKFSVFYLFIPYTPNLWQPLIFPECHVVEIIQYVTFSHWCLSLSNMPLRFTHVSSWLDSSDFYFLDKNSLPQPPFSLTEIPGFNKDWYYGKYRESKENIIMTSDVLSSSCYEFPRANGLIYIPNHFPCSISTAS